MPAASAARVRRADHAAHAVLPIIEAMRVDGISSLSGIAAPLNERGVPTPREGQWTATAVRRLLSRVDPAPAESYAGNLGATCYLKDTHLRSFLRMEPSLCSGAAFTDPP